MTGKTYWKSRLILKSLEKEGRRQGAFSGYASTFNTDQINDKILPGAFAQTLSQWEKYKGRYPHLYWEHDFGEVIGICHEVKEDLRGLHIRGKLLLDIPKAHEAYERLQQGTNGLSIGFFPRKTTLKGGVRHIEDLDLKEISLVDYPCNPEAEIYEFKNQKLRSGELKALKRLKDTLSS